MKPKLISSLITARRDLNRDIFSIELKIAGLRLQPGNFFQIRASDTFDPYLNRPISVAGYWRSRLLMIIRRVGRGTALLQSRKTGDRLLVFGPLGRGITPGKKKALLIAGGIGIAPLFFLARKLFDQGVPYSLIYGVRDRGEHILTGEIKRICKERFFVSERGSGIKMTALNAIDDLDLSRYAVIYACGPKGMLIELQRMKLDLPTYVFCEDFLGCGCGICLGCGIRINDEYKRICTDGPVFNLREIEFAGAVDD